MLTVRRLIHLTHVLADNDLRREAERFYLDVFAAQTFFDARPMPGLERDETLMLIGKSQIIPMAPIDETSVMAKDLRNYAGGFMGIALKVDATRPVIKHLEDGHEHLLSVDRTYVIFTLLPESYQIGRNSPARSSRRGPVSREFRRPSLVFSPQC